MDLNNDKEVLESMKKIKYLKEFIDSDGWKLIKGDLEKSIFNHAQDMCSKADMSESELHFRRGNINALLGLSTYPERLLAQLESNLPLTN